MKVRKKTKAVVLLSGGLDSATTLAIAGDMGFDVYALSFRYGQRHSVELKAAKAIARKNAVIQHLILDVDLRKIGGSALTADINVPKKKNILEFKKRIPVTYVPARNTIFLSYALAWAEVIGAHDIFIGVNVLDYSGYPDCRPKYIAAYEKMANLATKVGVEQRQRLKIHTPLIRMRKSQIIRKGIALGVDYSLTRSCYDPSVKGEACGACDSCLLRLKGFKEAGLKDPIQYHRSRNDLELSD